ncbi:MAG: 3',5'-cyclic-nucleotide phosphodiesterase [Polyangiaceae bacterium]
MNLTVLGCHGGESSRHRSTAFMIDERLVIDAGSITRQLTVADQSEVETILITHAHLDHVRDLATIADNRCQLNAPPLTVAATRETIAHLKAHFFNDKLWPDFTRIPCAETPTIRFQELPLEKPTKILDYEVTAIAVDHTIDSAGFVIRDASGAIAISGDTGPTDRLWEVLNEARDLKALLMEVSFPDRMESLASVSGHHTPGTLKEDLLKYKAPQDLPTLLYHIKPAFQGEVERACAKLEGLNLHVLQLDEKLDF